MEGKNTKCYPFLLGSAAGYGRLINFNETPNDARSRDFHRLLPLRFFHSLNIFFSRPCGSVNGTEAHHWLSLLCLFQSFFRLFFQRSTLRLLFCSGKMFLVKRNMKPLLPIRNNVLGTLIENFYFWFEQRCSAFDTPTSTLVPHIFM